MLCHTVPFVLARLGLPLPAGAPVAPAGFLGDDWRPSSAGYIDSDTVPARCHWSRAADEARCPAVLQQVEEAWLAQVDVAGFDAPLPDDDGLLDIYLTQEGTWGGAYTYGPWEDAVEGDDRMGTPAYIAMDWSISDEELGLYTVHEFNHALQYATDFVEPTYLIWESVAEAAVQWTYPENDVYTEYIVDFQRDPWMGLLGDGYQMQEDHGILSFYEYGGAAWIFHLEHAWGDGSGTAGAALWDATAQEGWINEPDVLDAYDVVTGDWQQAWLELSADRARLGTDDPPAWAEGWEGGVGLRVDYDGELQAAALPAAVEPEIGPYQTGISYVKVAGVAPGDAVSWSVEGGEALRWGSVAVQGARSEVFRAGAASFTSEGSQPVVIGVVNLGEDDLDGDDRIGPATITVHVELVEGATGDGGATDGGATDGGATDGGATDGGAGDGGAGDGGAGGGGAEPGEEVAGCGCGGGGAPLLAPLWLVAAGLLRRRRRA